MSDLRDHAASADVRHPARCPICDYDLSGTPTAHGDTCGGRCSECGLILHGATLSIALEQSFFRRLRIGLIIALLVVALAALATLATSGDHAVYLTPMLVLVVAPIAPVVLAVYCSKRLPED